MAYSRLGTAHREIELLFQGGTVSNHTDRQLLDRFLNRDDEPEAEKAFAVLVDRHGPMVWGICLRTLRDPGDAGDAFQATFLVLARRAGSVTLDTSLAPWLHGVSVRVARRARIVASRRRQRERTNTHLPDHPCHSSTSEMDDLRAVIDEELRWLPTRYRSPLILCHLKGLTHDEAAAQLSCPVGTVRSRLSRGRDLLRSRLLRRGLAPNVSVLTAPLEAETAQAAGFESLSTSTAQAAARLAAGRTLTGIVPTSVITIVAGVTQSMTFMKLGLTAVLVTLPCLAIAAFAAPKPAQRVQEATSPKTPASISASKPAQRVQEATPSKTPIIALTAQPNENEETSKDNGIFAIYPPFVMKTTPATGTTNVDPSLTEIRVTFSKEMIDKSWSVVQQTKNSFPEMGKIHYDKNHRTCIMPVKLVPNKTYALWLNTERFGNFKGEEDARSAVPYLLVFRTKAP